MPRLEDLKTSLVDMSEDQLRTCLRETRDDRRVTKHVMRASKAKQEGKVHRVRKEIASLGDKDREEFLKMLEEG